jgi:hypothetical protein
MFKQNKSTVNEVNEGATHNVNASDWRAATRDMKMVNLSNHASTERPAYRPSDDPRLLSPSPMGS